MYVYMEDSWELGLFLIKIKPRMESARAQIQGHLCSDLLLLYYITKLHQNNPVKLKWTTNRYLSNQIPSKILITGQVYNESRSYFPDDVFDIQIII